MRASCRLLVNISHFPGVVIALEKMGILERLLDCVYVHKEARDVVESTALLLRGTFVPLTRAMRSDVFDLFCCLMFRAVLMCRVVLCCRFPEIKAPKLLK